MRQAFSWQIGRRALALGERTLVMGIVNITPDSFSDGGLFLAPEQAVRHALELLEQGADILDLGGESTRPGAAVQPRTAGTQEAPKHAPHEVPGGSSSRVPSVSAEDEIARVVPVIERLKRERPDCVISIDTYKAAVARWAVAAGAEIVNDVSGGTWDAEMLPTVGQLDCGCVLMHMRGRPEDWRTLPPLDDVVGTVTRELEIAAAKAMGAGIARERIVLDPGYGFGKSFDENYPLLAHFGDLRKLDFPLLAGTSRKSFIGRTVGQRLAEVNHEAAHDVSPTERLHGTIATVAAVILKGAQIVRVHDVRPAIEAAAIADAIVSAE
ncbi:MAG TPA: dihydropteroate synthase [Bryobacteraceae bacterium]|nr:dihydropteroate synthase [Bryobacteraceae bacterium]